jgi:pantoate kinase
MTFKISVPLHLTGFFSPNFADNPLLAGSKGTGLVIVPGLTCICKFSEKKQGRNKVIYNGVKTKIKPVEKLFELTDFNRRVLCKISSPVPLGFGYGASAASTLAVSLALHRFLKKPDSAAARLAHIAEVKSLTGLGDVIALFEGKDLTIRTKTGTPGIGLTKSFSQKGNIRIVAVDLKKISTRKMLKSMSPAASRFGLKLLKKFIKNPDLENFFKYSQLFAKKMKFADENFFDKLEPLKKYCIGFTVKKGVLFAAAEQNKLKNAVSILKKISPAIHIFKFGGGIKKMYAT